MKIYKKISELISQLISPFSPGQLKIEFQLIPLKNYQEK